MEESFFSEEVAQKFFFICFCSCLFVEHLSLPSNQYLVSRKRKEKGRETSLTIGYLRIMQSVCKHTSAISYGEYLNACLGVFKSGIGSELVSQPNQRRQRGGEEVVHQEIMLNEWYLDIQNVALTHVLLDFLLFFTQNF